MNATFSATMTQFVDKVGDSLKATLTVNTPERVAGRVFTAAPVKTRGGESYTVDPTFDTAVARRPAGTRSPEAAAPGQGAHRISCRGESTAMAGDQGGADAIGGTDVRQGLQLARRKRQ